MSQAVAARQAARQAAAPGEGACQSWPHGSSMCGAAQLLVLPRTTYHSHHRYQRPWLVLSIPPTMSSACKAVQ